MFFIFPASPSLPKPTKNITLPMQAVKPHLSSCNRPFQYGFCTIDSLTFSPPSNAPSSIFELISSIFFDQ